MKTIIIGDIHGKDVWQTFVKEEFDRVIFVGDYFDSFTIKAPAQLENFENIMQFKRENQGKVITLLGNHDFHYTDFCESRYSGYQHNHSVDIREAVKKHLDEFQICYQFEDILVSHAGITKTFLKEKKTTVDNLNNDFKLRPEIFNFCGFNMYGDDITQGPLWVRPKSLLIDKVAGYEQVVGHTRYTNIETGDGVTFIDCLDTQPKCLVIEGWS